MKANSPEGPCGYHHQCSLSEGLIRQPRRGAGAFITFPRLKCRAKGHTSSTFLPGLQKFRPSQVSSTLGRNHFNLSISKLCWPFFQAVIQFAVTPYQEQLPCLLNSSIGPINITDMPVNTQYVNTPVS